METITFRSIEDLRRRPDEYAFSDTQINPPEERSSRYVRPCPPTTKSNHIAGTLEKARVMLPQMMREYLTLPDAGTSLLLAKALPGVGKTTAAVAIAEEFAALGYRIAYAGPRHDFFWQALDKAQHPEWWYEWLPRQDGDQGNNKPETCRYAHQIETWMRKGYDGMDFCSRICGWDYVNQRCPYHLQKERKPKIAFIQHPHITLGHPLEFDILIGDESPVQAFLQEMVISEKWIVPPSMEDDYDIKAILAYMTEKILTYSKHMEGEELLDFVGGPEYVIRACDQIKLIPGVDVLAPEIHNANEVENVPQFHLPYTIEILEREAQNYLNAIRDGRASDPANKGKLYPHRIFLHNHELHLLRRRNLANGWEGKPIIWLDATGEERIYAELFDRRVRVADIAPHTQGKIYQVTSRSNNKTAIIDPRDKKITSNGAQLEEQIGYIVRKYEYKDPVIISYQKFVEQSEIIARFKSAHFYAARGTNEFENCDAVIIAGLPQPSIPDLAKFAKMIFYNRDEPFYYEKFATQLMRFPDYIEQTDGEKARAFGREKGMGCEIPVGNFWDDPDLMAVLKMFREDEILQAAHRGRPVNRRVDIWLLLSAPIPGLPPDELMSIAELMDTPLDRNAFKFRKFEDAVRKIFNERIEKGMTPEQAAVTREDLIFETHLSERTVKEYYPLLMETNDYAEIVKEVRGLIPKNAPAARGPRKRGLIPKA